MRPTLIRCRALLALALCLAPLRAEAQTVAPVQVQAPSGAMLVGAIPLAQSLSPSLGAPSLAPSLSQPSSLPSLVFPKPTLQPAAKSAPAAVVAPAAAAVSQASSLSPLHGAVSKSAPAAAAVSQASSLSPLRETLSLVQKSLGLSQPRAHTSASTRFFDGSGSRQAAPVDVPGSLGRPAATSHWPTAAEFPGELIGSDGVEAVPGSIFGWKPFGESPGHGFWPLDALARWYFGREDRRFSKGFEDRGAARREEARVFFYGEKHSDAKLIAENMALLARDLSRGRSAGALILVEGYIGRDLHGNNAVRFLEVRGLDTSRLAPGLDLSDIHVRGWEDPMNYSETTRYSLRHHMELLNLNTLMHGEARGLGYYRELLRQAVRTLRVWREMRREVIDGRNKDLDRSLGQALSEAERSGAAVHVIAGAEHLVNRPLLADIPLLGSTRLRRGLRDRLHGLPYWSSKPTDTR